MQQGSPRYSAAPRSKIKLSPSAIWEADDAWRRSMQGTKRPLGNMAMGVGVGSLAEKCGSDLASDESSESDTETEETKAFHRRVSTSKAIKNGVCIKEGFLMKQTIPFQRWKRRYFKLKPRKLYYAKDNKSVIYEEVNLTDLSLAECSPKNVNHSFQLIIPFRRIILCAETRKEMEDWMSALRTVCNKDFYEGTENPDFLSGQHNWYVASHARPTYCNVCREALSGVTSHGLSCEVCKFKAHKRCAVKAPTNCKWTTLASVGKDIIEDAERNITMPHQWLEGNLPVSAKCVVCDKTCGSVLRLQDWRCLWCRAMVHTACKSEYPERCPLGICRVSVVPPTALHNIGNDEAWEAIRPVGCSPLLVFVNSKSGDNQGVKFLRRFKQLLNPAQVFDLMNCGPGLGLRMFRTFHPLRILVCGGDGSVSWVLTEIDKFRLHKQCQIGVLPLGTGNDLARVLGWGSVCDDDTQLPQLLEKYERASMKLLDRWSIMTYEGTMHAPRKISAQYDPITVYEDSVVAHLSKILHSDQHSVVISSAKVLCETVKDFIAKVGVAYSQEGGAENEDSISHKCAILNQKLDLLLQALHEESLASTGIPEEEEVREERAEDGAEKRDSEKVVVVEEMTSQEKKGVFVQREALMSRANSLKKAVRQIIEHTERAVDEQNDQTKERQALAGEVEGPEIVIQCDEASAIGTPDQSKFTLPIFKTTCYDEERPGGPAPQPWNPWGPSMGQSVGAPLKDTLQVTLPTIEGGASADSSPCPSPRSFIPLSPSPVSSPCPSPVPPPSETASTPVLETPDQDILLRTPSPALPSSAASRRISSGSTLKRVGNISLPLGAGLALPILPKEKSISTEEVTKREFPIINPLASLPMWPNLTKDSLIGKVLLANSDVLCAAASPLMDVEEISLEGFEEKCVMNNYFGIGLDAKITLEFHNKREEHPEKCRSRTKNLMWYGVLGGKELLQRTFKNLEQRVQLECDGCRIPLPSLQGIVVLNIPSYGGGSNFWGGTKEDDLFYAPAFDDKILEVVAVFGTVQMAASRVINLQHHRIAQCRSVKITIMGDEGVPVQVDGEAWIQSPGYICILHKNRTQVLCRNRQLESSLKMWQEKARGLAPSRSLLLLPFSDEEIQILSGFIECAYTFISQVKLASLPYSQVEDALYPMATETANFMERLFPAGRMIEGPNVRQQVSDFISSVRNLYHETVSFLREKEENTPSEIHFDEKLNGLILGLETELRKCSDFNGVVIFHSLEEEEQKKHRSLFKLKFKKQWKSSSSSKPEQRASRSSSGDTQSPSVSGSCGGGTGCGTPPETPSDGVLAQYWSSEEIGLWLDSIQMGEYKENFLKHDIQGPELLDLERRDLKELGISKVGHIKRILQAIKDIHQQNPQKRAF